MKLRSKEGYTLLGSLTAVVVIGIVSSLLNAESSPPNPEQQAAQASWDAQRQSNQQFIDQQQANRFNDAAIAYKRAVEATDPNHNFVTRIDKAEVEGTLIVALANPVLSQPEQVQFQTMQNLTTLWSQHYGSGSIIRFTDSNGNTLRRMHN